MYGLPRSGFWACQPPKVQGLFCGTPFWRLVLGELAGQLPRPMFFRTPDPRPRPRPRSQLALGPLALLSGSGARLLASQTLKEAQLKSGDAVTAVARGPKGSKGAWGAGVRGWGLKK